MKPSAQINQVLDMKKSNKEIIKSKISPWLFVLPGIIFTAWLKYYPIFKALYISMFNYDVVNPPGRFVGLKNYKDILSQQMYWKAWENTFWFLLITILLTFFIPIIQAIFLNEIIKLKRTLTTIYLVIALIPISVNVILWKWIWHPDYGIANTILNALGFSSKMWLSDPSLTKFCIIFPSIIGGGVGVLMYLAAIQGIPKEIYESSQIDGCTGWKKIFYMILPNIKFIILIQLVICVINTMQILDAPYQFAAGGPNGASTSMAIYIYKTANENLSYGRANAASLILFVIIAIITVIQLKMDNTETE